MSTVYGCIYCDRARYCPFHGNVNLQPRKDVPVPLDAETTMNSKSVFHHDEAGAREAFESKIIPAWYSEDMATRQDVICKACKTFHRLVRNYNAQQSAGSNHEGSDQTRRDSEGVGVLGLGTGGGDLEASSEGSSGPEGKPQPAQAVPVTTSSTTAAFTRVYRDRDRTLSLAEIIDFANEAGEMFEALPDHVDTEKVIVEVVTGTTGSVTLQAIYQEES